MRRLRKFNESNSEIDKEFIYECFAELIDDGKAEFIEYKNEYNHYITIDLEIKQSNPEKRDTGRAMEIKNSKLLSYINDIKYNSNLLQEVEVGLGRISEQYPEYRVNFDVFAYSIFINIHAGEEKKEEYPF